MNVHNIWYLGKEAASMLLVKSAHYIYHNTPVPAFKHSVNILSMKDIVGTFNNEMALVGGSLFQILSKLCI